MESWNSVCTTTIHHLATMQKAKRVIYLRRNPITQHCGFIFKHEMRDGEKFLFLLLLKQKKYTQHLITIITTYKNNSTRRREKKIVQMKWSGMNMMEWFLGGGTGMEFKKGFLRIYTKNSYVCIFLIFLSNFSLP